MSWTDLVLPVSIHRVAAITVAGTPKGRQVQSLRIAVRPDQMEDGPGWFAAGKAVRVMAGAGEHAGMLRIVPVPSGGVRIGATGGKRQIPILTLPGYRPLPAERQKSQAVDYDYGSDWIEITLPDWARPAAASAAAAAGTVPPAATTKAATTPFVGLGTRGHTETFAGRKGGGGPIREAGR